MWGEEVQAGSGERDIGHAAQRPYPVCVAGVCFSWPLFSFLWQEGRQATNRSPAPGYCCWHLQCPLSTNEFLPWLSQG